MWRLAVCLLFDGKTPERLLHVRGEVRRGIVGSIHQTNQERRHSTDILTHITSLRIDVFIIIHWTTLFTVDVCYVVAETLLAVFTCHLVEGTIIFCSRSFLFQFAVLRSHRAKLSQTLPQIPKSAWSENGRPKFGGKNVSPKLPIFLVVSGRHRDWSERNETSYWRREKIITNGPL